MKQKHKISYSVFPLCSLILAGCSTLGISDSEPHLVTLLEGFGGAIGASVSGATKNSQQEMTRTQGRGENLGYSEVCNIGKESKGLRISAKGSTIANGTITNLIATVTSEGTPENIVDRIIYLHKVAQDTWSGETMFPLKTQQPAGILGGSGKVNQVLTVTVYGDTLFSGTGNLEIVISPYENTHQPPVKILQKLIITSEHDLSEKLFSAPSDFPLSIYPNSYFVSAGRFGTIAKPDDKSNQHVQLASKDSPEQVVQFYKNDVTSRGFHIEKENPITIEGVGFYGNNGSKEITLDVTKDKDDEKKTLINFTVTPYNPSALTGEASQ